MPKRFKVLVSAYACEPGKGSEPGVGWNWMRQIARFHEVWVITRANNRPPIERKFEKKAMRNVHWVYFDLPRWARFWKKGQRAVHLYYYLWQIGAYFVGKQLHKEISFDLVHHLTFGNYWLPSFFSLLSIPFVWGPVGGGDSTPKEFYKTYNLRGRVYEHLRNLARRFAQLDPFVRVTAKSATFGIVNTDQTKSKVQLLGCKNIMLYSHMGVSLDEVPQFPIRRSNPFRIASVGRLLHWKGFHLGLEAFAHAQEKLLESEYWVIGDGPELQNLKRIAQMLSVAKKVRFLGNLPQEKTIEKLADCDVLVHPSLHDSAPAICLEAMACGRPVICLDLGGPALQVTGETGFKVLAITPQQVVNEMAKAMIRLARDPELRARMGSEARRRVEEHFSWGRKGELIREIYEKVV